MTSHKNPYKECKSRKSYPVDEAMQTVFGIIAGIGIVGILLIGFIILIAKS